MILLLLSAVAAESTAETPHAFVERLYANYSNADYSPFNRPERVFTHRLIAAIKEDSRPNRDEVGYIDADPICRCQDAEGLHASVTMLLQPNRNRADVRITLHFAGYEARPMRLSLQRVEAVH